MLLAYSQVCETLSAPQPALESKEFCARSFVLAQSSNVPFLQS